MNKSEEKMKTIARAFSDEPTILAPETAGGPRPEKKPRRGLRAFLIVLMLAALLIAAAAGMEHRYQDRFYRETRIMGTDVSHLTAPEATDRLYAAAEASRIVLRDGRGAELCALDLGDLLSREDLAALCAALMEEQHAGQPLLAWLRSPGSEYYPRPLEALTDERAAAVLENALYGSAARREPRNAELVLTDTGFQVIPEENGNLVDVDRAAAALTAAVRTVDRFTGVPAAVDAGDVRILPEITVHDNAIRHQSRWLASYLDTRISLSFRNGKEYALTPEDIWSVSAVSLTDTTARAEPDPELVAELVDRLADEYGVDGVFAKFFHTSETREYNYYRVGDTGWKMDREALAREVYGAIRAQADAVLAPDYDYTWYWENYYNCGNTYLEISLDNQYMWYYVDGKLLVETPVVTGDLATHHGTHRGFFWIVHKTTDTTLSGPTWNDHVDYWMPFDIPNEIGLHDSSWRDEYGGDIYISDGSHGCVNTPLEAMGMIYDNIRVGTPVIIY